jgi:hypothetical protein
MSSPAEVVLTMHLLERTHYEWEQAVLHPIL